MYSFDKETRCDRLTMYYGSVAWSLELDELIDMKKTEKKFFE